MSMILGKLMLANVKHNNKLPVKLDKTYRLSLFTYHLHNIAYIIGTATMLSGYSKPQSLSPYPPEGSSDPTPIKTSPVPLAKNLSFYHAHILRLSELVSRESHKLESWCNSRWRSHFYAQA